MTTTAGKKQTPKIKTGKAVLEAIYSIKCPYCGGFCEGPTGSLLLSEAEFVHLEDNRELVICNDCRQPVKPPANPYLRKRKGKES